MNVKRAFKKYKITNPLFIAGNGIEALSMLRSDEGKPPEVPTQPKVNLVGFEYAKNEWLRVFARN